MKEYATLVTDDVSSPYSYPTFSTRRSSGVSGGNDGESMIQRLMKDGWEVIDACPLPRLSTIDVTPKFAFMLERELATADGEGK